MKKILLMILATTSAITMSTRSFGQGEVAIFNTAATAIFLNNGTTTSKMFGSAGTFDIGLYMGSAGSFAIEQMQLVDLVASPNAALTSFNAGLFSGGTVTSPGNVANTLNFQAGTQYAFYVAVWASFGGSNYATLPAGTASGVSALGYITPVSSPTPVPNVFGTSPGQILGFGIITVPEPSSLALGSLGAAVLLLFRRRK